jgi:signal transduction histidine kinase
VVEAGNGASALRMLDTDSPALVILDEQLPDMSGIDVCREIKARSPSTLVLQTSAALIGKHDRASRLVGADAYLVEPIAPQELRATVESLLRLSRAERQLRASHTGLENLVGERTRELADANERLRAEIAEREKTQDILRHAQKMDVLGQLTGGIAHDFNNLLAIILGNLEILRRRLTDPKLALYADNAFYGARRAATLTRQLLSFSRRQSLAPRGVELDKVIAEITVLLRQTLGERVEIDTTVPKDLWPVFVDLGELEAAILNLAVNGRDAMAGAGRLTLSLRNVAATAPRSPDAAGRMPPAGDYVALSMGDTGQGMTPDVIQNAFEPFFTTKDIGHGTGLGLSQVYGFVSQSGGMVLVDTEVGHGSTLTLCLPRHAGDIEAPAHVPGTAAPKDSHATVLIVEDDDHVRAHSVEILRELGYAVEQANTAKSALEVLEKRKDIQLLFTDIGLPGGMNGVSLAENATRRQPSLKVLLTTGYALEQQDPAHKKFPLLPKPFTFAMLGRRLHETLYPPSP